MKNFVKFLFLFILLIFPPSVQAITFNVVVLPVDILNVCDNYYCFPESSEILAGEVIKYFNSGNKVVAPPLNDLRAGFSKNAKLYETATSVVGQYDRNNTVNYSGVKEIARSFDAKSVLLISSVVVSNRGMAKRSVWEVLEVSSVFDIEEQSYELKTDAVLLDTVNDIVMWSGTFKRTLGAKTGFVARNSAQANSKLDLLRMYFKDIVAPDVSQNIVLRFFPKSIEPLSREKATKEEIYKDGSLLRFEKNLPKQKNENSNDIPMEEMGEMIFGI